MRQIPTLSVIIVNHNGYEYLQACIQSIQKSLSWNDLEIIIVDNGSNKDPAKIQSNLVIKNKITLISLDQNYGPAYARNQGVAQARGKYLAFLDNDTQVHSKWAQEAIKYFDKNPKAGVIQCKLLLASDHTKLDYVGEYLGTNGFLVQECKAGDKDQGQFETVKQILAAKSAGMFIRKDTFDKAGGFDNDYFIYVEETDLGWRSWLVGYQAIYLPTSIVYHHFGTSTVILGLDKASSLAKYHGPKNYITTLIKNFGTKNLFTIVPVHIFLWFGLAFYRLISGKPSDFLLIIRGIIWPFTHLNQVLTKRKAIQSKRVISDKKLFQSLMVKRSFVYYLKKGTRNQKVGNSKSF